jgi:hypothetical protein
VSRRSIKPTELQRRREIVKFSEDHPAIRLRDIAAKFKVDYDDLRVWRSRMRAVQRVNDRRGNPKGTVYRRRFDYAEAVALAIKEGTHAAARALGVTPAAVYYAFKMKGLKSPGRVAP